MAERDPFTRRTATPAALAPWLVEVVRTLPALARSYGPRSPVPARTRERLILAVTDVNGCRYTAWVHGAWRDFLGEVPPVEAEGALLDYARACAAAGVPLRPDALRAVLPAEAVAVVRATVAQVEVANLVGNTVDGVLARLRRHRPLAPLALAREVTTIAWALPVAVPAFVAAGAMRAVERLAPALPPVDAPDGDDANLLAHLLATSMPAYLANAMVRAVTVGLPFSVAIGFRAGRSAATVRVGGGAVAVENGIAGDALLVVEGDGEQVARLAAGSLLTELGTLRLRGS